MTTKQKPERVSLNEFLSDLNSEKAAQLRAIAGRIDELEQRTSGLANAEHQLMPALWVGGIMTTIGIIAMVSGTEVYNLFESIISKAGITILLSGLPVALVVYASRVFPRSVADNQKMDLNTKHFLPNDGLYFPATSDEEPACVVRVKQPKPKLEPKRPDRHGDISAGRIW